jgi:signal peptidase
MHLRVTRIVRGTAGLLAGLVVLAAGGYAALVVAGYRPVAVYSGSMKPTIGVGSLAVVEPVPARDVRVGDVVTFADPFVKGRLVTHRVVRILHERDGHLAYRTKGDANPIRDPWTIELPDQVGRYRFDVPFAGYALVYARTREIRTVLLLAAAVAGLYWALALIWRQGAEAEPA